MALPPVRTEEELASLATSILAKTVYFLEDLPWGYAPCVFLPLALGAGDILGRYSEEELTQISIFGRLNHDSVSPMRYNGYPVFLSMQIWRREDVIKAQEKASQAQRLLASEREIPERLSEALCVSPNEPEES